MSVIEVPAERSGVVVRSAESPTTYVRLFAWSRIDDSGGVCAVEAVADSLRACVDSAEITAPVGAASLGGFLGRLVEGGAEEGAAGAADELAWQSRQLDVRVRKAGGGRTVLRWTLRAEPFTPRGWQASVTTVLEGAAQLRALAEEVEDFFRGSGIRHQG